jgi:hypothetical protein
MVLHPGKEIIRIRPNKPGETFNTRSALSYVPAEFNKKYQRASTPEQTMFYGSVIPEKLEQEELQNARITSFLEGSPLMRNPAKIDGDELVTFSKWVVTCDIHLLAIVYHRDFLTASPHTQDLYDAYKQGTKAWSADERDKSTAITEFLAAQFAKKDINDHTDYKISAIFSQMVVGKGMDGVYFPSVRVDAKGYNVAISPAVADSCLKLVAAGECTAYRRGDHTIVDNETVCTIEDDKLPFTMERIAAEHRAGRESILRELERKNA